MPGTDAPAIPLNLFAETVTAGYVSLAWDTSAGAVRYQVYRNGIPLGQATLDTTTTDDSVVPETTYSYRVQAFSDSAASELSAELAVTTSANTLPSWSLTDQSGTIGTAFSLNLNTVCSDADDHTLAFTLTSGSVPGLSLSSPNYAGSPTTAGAYSLTFRANDGYGTSDITITFTVADPDVVAPTVPTDVSAAANGSTVTVSWTESTDASGVATYRVYRDGVFRAVSAASPYVESGVPVGSYSYTVSAVDSSANANESAQSSAAPVTVVPQTPDTPINFTAVSDGATTINLSWAAGPNGSTPDDYDLDFSATSASGPWTAIPFVGTATTYAHTGRTAGTTYYYRVRAGLGASESGYATASAGGVAVAHFIIPGNVSSWNAAASQPRVIGGNAIPNTVPNVVIELSAGTSTTVATAGTRSAKLAIANLSPVSGTATVRNPAAGVVTISGSSFVFTLTGTPRNVIIDGTNGGQTYGIKVQASSVNSFRSQLLKVYGLWQNITIRGVECDGRDSSWTSSRTAGIGINVNDLSLTMTNNQWKDGLLITGCYVHNLGGEGMYIGANYASDEPPLRNVEISYNLVEDTGRSGINPKTTFEGTNSVHHNTLRRCGRNVGDEAAQCVGLKWNSSVGDMYNNWIEDSGEGGMSWRIQNGPPYNATFPPGDLSYGPYSTFTVRAYNNVVVNSGVLSAGASGYGINAGGGAGLVKLLPYYYNNTVVDNRETGVQAGADVATGGWARNNVIIGNGAVSSGITATDNKTSGTLTAAYRLTSDDAATGTVGTAPTHQIAPTDYDGDTRTAGTADKGAYEYP